MELFASCFGLMLPLRFKHGVLSQRIKRLKLKALAEQSLIRAKKLIDGDSEDGNAMKIVKSVKVLEISNEQTQCKYLTLK